MQANYFSHHRIKTGKHSTNQTVSEESPLGEMFSENEWKHQFQLFSFFKSSEL